MQEFYILKCYSCELYQNHIVKKAKQWNCKVCGTKQSIIKIYGQGDAKDCRLRVQMLNKQRNQDSLDTNLNDSSHTFVSNVSTSQIVNEPKPSKWKKYVDCENPVQNDTSGSLVTQQVSSSNSSKCFIGDERRECSIKLYGTRDENQKEIEIEDTNMKNVCSSPEKTLQFSSNDELNMIDDILKM